MQNGLSSYKHEADPFRQQYNSRRISNLPMHGRDVRGASGEKRGSKLIILGIPFKSMNASIKTRLPSFLWIYDMVNFITPLCLYYSDIEK